MYRTKLQVVKQLDDVGFKIENNPVVVELADELNVRGKFEDKIKIIELHKNAPINFSIHKLSDILSINRPTISRWVNYKLKLQMILKIIIYNYI